MKLLLLTFKALFSTLSVISPRLEGKVAIRLFKTVRKKEIREREKAFYDKATHHTVPFPSEDLHYYEYGHPEGQLVFLIHGWDSNVGSLSKIAYALADNNYRIIALDLPAHAHYHSKRTHLPECKDALKALIMHIDPTKPFHVVSHSFGSAVIAYALSQLNYKANKLVFLSTPNAALAFFYDFKNMFNISDKAFEYFIDHGSELAKEDIHGVRVDEKIQQAHYEQLLIIHDRNDKVIPHKNAEAVLAKASNAQLSSYEDIGHYRMLWNEEVIGEVVAFLEKLTK